jgi:ABC-type Fe3+-siderophore transport system permease subunit
MRKFKFLYTTFFLVQALLMLLAYVIANNPVDAHNCSLAACVSFIGAVIFYFMETIE